MAKQVITLNRVQAFGIRKGVQSFKVQGRHDATPKWVAVDDVEVVGFQLGFTEFADKCSAPTLVTGEWVVLENPAAALEYQGGEIYRQWLPSGTRVKKIAHGNAAVAGVIAVRHQNFEEKVVEKLGGKALALMYK